LERAAPSRFRLAGRDRDDVCVPGYPAVYGIVADARTVRQAGGAAPLFAKAARRPAQAPLDLTSTEDAQLLSAQEFELCSTLRILPRAYLTIKGLFIQESNAQVRLIAALAWDRCGRVWMSYIVGLCRVF
jgi:hypothetical protein